MLSGKEKRQFRAQANQIKASVYIGKDGITDQVCEFIYQALGNKELVKVKILESQAEEFKPIVEKLSGLKDIEVVQVIGRTVLLYRPLPDDDKA